MARTENDCIRCCFNPRAPRGARHRLGAIRDRPRAVSIHAPRAGRDDRTTFLPQSMLLFQSTRPARGATGIKRCGRESVGGGEKGCHFRRLKRRQRRRRESPIGGDAVQTLYQFLKWRDQRYSGSLQLFASENSLGTRSCPQIFRPARFGHWRKWSFRSFQSIDRLASLQQLLAEERIQSLL